jgi:hypothetical protein
MGYENAEISTYTEFAIVLTLACWVQFVCRLIATALTSRVKRVAHGSAPHSWNRVWRSACISLIRVSSAAWAFTASFLSAIITKWGVVVAIAGCVTLGVIVTETHAEVIPALDEAYNALYLPVVAPIRLVINVVRLLGDAVLPIMNALSETIAAPVSTVIKISWECDAGGDVFTSWITNSTALVMDATTSVTRWAFLDRLASPLDLKPVVMRTRYLGQGAFTLLSCACESAAPLGRAVLSFMFNPRTDEAVSETVNAVLGLAQVPANATLLAFSTSAWPRIYFEYPLDRTTSAVRAWENVTNDWLNQVVRAIDVNATAPPVFSVPAAATLIVVEALRVPAAAMAGADALLAGNVRLARDIFMAASFWDAVDGLLATTESVVLMFTQITLPYVRAARYGLATAIANVRLAWEFLVGIITNALGAPIVTWAPPFRDHASCYSYQGAQNGYNATQIAPRDSLGFSIAFVGRYDQLWVQNLRQFSHWLSRSVLVTDSAMTELALNSAAELLYAVVAKAAYLAGAARFSGNLRAACLSDLSSQWRAESFAFARAYSDANVNIDVGVASFRVNTAFLDPVESLSTHIARLPCQRATVPNYALTGGLSAYHAVGNLCNAKFVNEVPIKCDMRDADSCPDYNLPFGDLVVNPICAISDLSTTALRTVVEGVAIGIDVLDIALVAALNCLKPTATCQVEGNLTSLQVRGGSASKLRSLKMVSLEVYHLGGLAPQVVQTSNDSF